MSILSSLFQFFQNLWNKIFGGNTPSEQIWTIQNSDLTVSASSKYAGAISSVVWKGQQFIDCFDHGRELQSACSFDRLGECFNPTEGGSKADATGPTSSSKLLSISVSNNILTSKNQMAFWNQPGQKSTGCPNGAVNKTVLSDYILTKTVRLSGPKISHEITFTVPVAHTAASFEVLTAYLPTIFANFWMFDPKTGKVSPLNIGPPTEQLLPIIISTADKKFAMAFGIKSQPQGASLFYGRWDHPGLQPVQKINCGAHFAAIVPGDYAFAVDSFVGTLDEVVASLSA